MTATSRTHTSKVRPPDGFTLVELIASIVLISLLGAMFTSALIYGVKGYIVNRENVSMIQKTRLAMARLTLELSEIITIDTASSNSLVYSRAGTTGEVQTMSVGLGDGNTVVMDDDATFDDGSVLVDNIMNSDLFQYNHIDGGSWSTADPLNELISIQVTLRTSVSQNVDNFFGTQTFSFVVNPRNNGLLSAPAFFR